MNFISAQPGDQRIPGAIPVLPDQLPNAAQHSLKVNQLLDKVYIELVPDRAVWSQWANGFRNQWYRGTCVGFGTTRALEIDNSMLYGRKISYLSPKCCYENAMQFDGFTEWRKQYEEQNHVPYADGTTVIAAAEGLKQFGVALEADDPYDENMVLIGTDKSPKPSRMTDRYKILDYTTHYVGRQWRTPDMNDQDSIEDLIAMLQLGCVAITLICDENFFFPTDPKLAIQPVTNNTVTDAHCVCLTGYDRNYGTDGTGGPNGKEDWRNTAFSFDNSWGMGYPGHWLSAEFILERVVDATFFHINDLLSEDKVSVTQEWSADLNDDSYINMADVMIGLRQLTGNPILNDYSGYQRPAALNKPDMPPFAAQLLGWNKSDYTHMDILDILSELRQAIGESK